MSRPVALSPALISTASIAVLVLLACSDGGADGVGSGGSSSGGASSGGTGSGGDATGAGSGGAASGGAASGGAAAGGTESGGASGGTGSGGQPASGGGDGSGGAEGGDFTLTSAELTDGGMFPVANTCASGMGQMGFGEAISLSWSGFPAGTKSFALTMIDVTLVDEQDSYLGCHSAFWNVPVETTSMPAGSWDSALAGAGNIRNGYLGPCPNFGGGTNEDTYVFTLYAMGEESIASPGNFNNLDSCNMVRDTLDSAALAKVTLTGTSNAVGGN